MDMLKNSTLIYPADVIMKIIMHGSYSDSEQKGALNGVFNELTLNPEEWKEKPSKSGLYKSYSLKLRIRSREQLDIVYEKLGNLPEVKLIL